MKEEIDYEVNKPKEEEKVYVTPSASNEVENEGKWQTKAVIGLIVAASIVAAIALMKLI